MEFSHLLSRCLDRQLRAPCLLLVHEEISQLHRVGQEVAAVLAQAPLDIGLLLSEALLLVPAQRRAGRVQTVLLDALRTRQEGPVLCTEIDLLFEPTLAQDPLLLLRACSRQTPLIILWPGAFHANILAYGVQTHGHYRTWFQPEVQAGCIHVIA
jgi:hypothetical protein